MNSRRALFRSEQWWNHKIPPLVAICAVAIGAGEAATDEALDLLLLLTSVIGVAAFGHLVNDWADIEADAKGGKHNRLASLRSVRRAQITGGALAVGVLPWLLLPRRELALCALVVELLLLVAYSVPPIRLKARGWLGALADACYAYAVPFVLAGALFGAGDVGAGALVLLGSWGLLLGLRGILWHQVVDHDADRFAGVETVARRIGPSRTEAIVGSVLLPLELAAAAALVVVADAGWLPWLIAGFLVYRTFQVLVLWVPPLHLGDLGDRTLRVRIIGFDYVNEFAERWLPFAALTAIALTSGGWWWLVLIAYLVLFRNAVRTIVGVDMRVLPDALERLTFSVGLRADIRRIATARQARVASGPCELFPSPAPQRFVFVVCGPASHLLTLRTAVHHLRPVTNAEIWVLTDGRRNELVVDIDGVDNVVEVATPAELDDHQASIWLKTSLHRHLPAGEWCYLDSDIIAIAPGVEDVFGERDGPVAFASDLTIRENSVDRFSPWAMTCSCLGYGVEHSCSHLRDQLRNRFDLEVPGDWLHWNGGVFVFGPESREFLDLWHERAVESFSWPEWQTRDQGALIATAWTLGLQDMKRISPEFNFIADLGNSDLCLDADKGWAHHPSGPWYDAKLMHLYTSALEDPDWCIARDLEEVVIRRSRVRVYRWKRAEAASRARRIALRVGYGSSRSVYWARHAIHRAWHPVRRALRRAGDTGLREARRVWYRVVAAGWTVRLGAKAVIRRARNVLARTQRDGEPHEPSAASHEGTRDPVTSAVGRDGETSSKPIVATRVPVRSPRTDP